VIQPNNDNLLTIKPHLHDTTCCQIGLTTSCIVYTNIQPVVKPEPVWQTVGCLFARYSRLSNRLYNWFDNRLYRV